jgi:hypothetical protein
MPQTQNSSFFPKSSPKNKIKIGKKCKCWVPSIAEVYRLDKFKVLGFEK